MLQFYYSVTFPVCIPTAGKYGSWGFFGIKGFGTCSCVCSSGYFSFFFQRHLYRFDLKTSKKLCSFFTFRLIGLQSIYLFISLTLSHSVCEKYKQNSCKIELQFIVFSFSEKAVKCVEY